MVTKMVDQSYHFFTVVLEFPFRVSSRLWQYQNINPKTTHKLGLVFFPWAKTIGYCPIRQLVLRSHLASFNPSMLVNSEFLSLLMFGILLTSRYFRSFHIQHSLIQVMNLAMEWKGMRNGPFTLNAHTSLIFYLE